ncbi:MAG: response regulator [Pirellulales bacterium]|nr:response regulator [Pirellulales bacterium]
MGRLRILIVDDEEDLAFTMAERLILRGFRCEAMTNGIDALKALSEEHFDVLVLDVKMPGIDGLQMMTEIRQTHPDLPVILITGHGSAADAERGMRAGAFDYIMKPIDIERVIQMIHASTGAKKDEKP